jgi:hypothetical protein
MPVMSKKIRSALLEVAVAPFVVVAGILATGILFWLYEQAVNVAN